MDKYRTIMTSIYSILFRCLAGVLWAVFARLHRPVLTLYATLQDSAGQCSHSMCVLAQAEL